jgi:hypothetical protein
MPRRFWILILVVFTVSCNFPGSQPTATHLPTSTPDLVITPITFPITGGTESTSTESPLPTQTASSTPSITLASAREQPVNCRFGPDISYAVIGALNPGRQAEVIGKNIDITWLFVRNPSDPSTSCWLSIDFINVDGTVDLLPVVGPPEIRVTQIEVSIEPAAMNVGCEAFPQSVLISAEITTNGPSVVIWYWESNTGRISDEKQVLFESGGTKTVQDYYVVDRVADYSVRVSTTLPNTAVGEANFRVICTP